MKIAMLGQKGIPTSFGGVERHVEELSIRLADRGHEVVVYCRPWYRQNSMPGTRYTEFKKVKLIRISSFKTKNFDAISHTFFSSVHAMIKERPDIYHYHGVGPALLAFLPRCFRPSSRVITTFHCIDRKHQKWGLLARVMLRLGEWAACRFAHQTITVSRTLSQYCKDVYETNTVYIPNGIAEHGVIDPSLLKRFNLAPNQYIAMVSRLVRHKGAHYLIEAWNILCKEPSDLMRNKKLAIVGDSAFTDEYVQSLKSMAQGNPSVVFTGYQSGAMLEALFSGASFIVHPSESEGLPIAVLEAMSYGKVVLASDIPENREAIADHGFQFPSGDIVALKEKIIDLLEHRDQLPKLGSEAREFVLREYHWNDIAAQVESLYQQTLPNELAAQSA